MHPIVKKLKRVLESTHPAKLSLMGFTFYNLMGWLLLTLPFCHKEPISTVDTLFTATSAVSTTGLLTIPIAGNYSFLGQIVILFLIQIGGIGYATLGSFVIISTTQKISDFHKKVSLHEFPLPKGFNIAVFIRHVIFYTLACETIGAIILSLLFLQQDTAHPVWAGIFHSVSAFCTAGISLFPDNLISYRDNFWINAIISLQCLMGAIGFIVWIDLYKKCTQKAHEISFTSRTILAVSSGFLVFGTAIFYLTTEFPSNMPLYEQILISFFQTMTASTTAGFTSMPIGTLTVSTLTLLLFLMAFGASPSGTGGGLKSTTFAALLGLLKSALRGKDIVSFWGRKIPFKRVQVATSSFVYYAFILLSALFVFSLFENQPFLLMLFETSSALSNIGLSMGITKELTPIGKLFVTFLMYMGRMGIMTFGIALAFPNKTWKREKEEHELVL